MLPAPDTPPVLKLPESSRGGTKAPPGDNKAGVGIVVKSVPNNTNYGQPAEVVPKGFEIAPAQADTNKFPVVDFPVDKIVVNKDIIQFKENADPKSGVVEPLEGQFRKPPEVTSNPIALWEKANGEVEVITGRHRLDLTKRSGEQTILAQVLREKNGFTKAMALTFDAESNILDGQGRIKDYAYYFRNTPELTKSEAGSKGLLARIKGTSGWHLGRDAGEGLFTSYANGQIPEGKAVAIARGAPGNDAAQASAMRVAKTKSASELELELYARNLARITPDESVQSDQMGFDGVSDDFAAFEAEAEKIAKVQFDRIKANSDLIESAQGAAKRPEAANKMGLAVDNPDALKARIDELKDANAKLTNPDAETFEMLRKEAGLPPTAKPSADGEMFAGDTPFNLAGEEVSDSGPNTRPVDDQTESMFGDKTKSTPPTEMDKRNESARGGVEGNIAPTGEGGLPGGDPGTLRSRNSVPAQDNPNSTQFVIELPELVAIAKALGAGKFPAVLENLRALRGNALGLFRHIDGPGGFGEIELRADIFELITPAEKARMRQSAEEFARVMKEADPSVNQKDVAKEKYEQDLAEAFEAAQKKNPVLASKVLAHEIGHWIDWLPDNMISGRGNLLGRIASLKGFTKSVLPERPGALGELTNKDRDRLRREAEKLARQEREGAGVEDVDPGVAPEEILDIWQNTSARDKDPGLYDFVAKLTPKQKKDLVKSAMRGKVADWFVFKRDTMPNLTKGEREYYAELLKAEINKRRLWELEQMKSELRDIIAWWRGTEKMEQYFEPSAEMYAESLSILLNNPAALMKRAPSFYQAFFNYLETKPEVKKLYNQIQDDIKSGKIFRDRVRGLRESWSRADDEGISAENIAMFRPVQEKLDDVRVSFDRIFGPVYRRMKSLKRAIKKEEKQSRNRNPLVSGFRSQQLRQSDKTEKAIEDFLYRSTMHELFVRQLNLDVLGPLTRANLDWIDLGEYMFHQHVVNNRANIANPGGHNSKSSNERLEEMRADLGPQRFAELEAGQARYRAVYEDVVIQRLADAKVLEPKLLKLIRERSFYATMSKVENASEIPPESIEAALHGRYGDTVSSRIYKQVGYLGDVKNPATATAQKAMSLLTMTYREQAKREIVNFLLSSGDPLVQEAPMRFNGRFREPQSVNNDRIATMVFLDKGKVRAYYVPRAIYDAFDSGNPIDARIASMIYKFVGPLKAIYTELNYGFWPVATVRDIRAFARKLPNAKIFLSDKAIVRYLQRAREAAKFSLDGRSDELADEALRRQMVISRADPRGEGAADNEFERMLLRYGMNPESWRDKNLSAGNSLVKAWRWYTRQGQINERMVKISGMMYLDEHFAQMPEVMKQRLVHESAGSPNFLQRPRSGPILDFFLLFYNPWKEGLRSEKRAWTRNPWEMMGKFALYTAPLTIAAWMLEKGLMDDLIPEEAAKEYRDMYRSIPEYDKTSYHIIPLFWADKEQGKVLYFRLPLEEGERMLNGVLRKSLTAGEGGEGILNFAGGQLPGQSPILQTIFAWFAYKVQGNNPYDTFRGRKIIPQTEFDAGAGDERMLKWTWNQLGGGIITRFGDESVFDPEPGEIEKFLKLPFVSNLLGRWIKVSNRGLTDEAQGITEPIKRERAADRLAGMRIVEKLSRGEALEEAEKQALLTNEYLMDYVVSKFSQAVIQSRVDPETRFWLRAGSTAERNALIEASEYK